MRRSNFNSEKGSAQVEFLGFGVVFIIPLMLFGIDVIGRQNDQFAAASIAEHSLRSLLLPIASNPNQGLNFENFETTWHQIATDFHEPLEAIRFDLDCGHQGTCEPGGQPVILHVQVRQANATAVLRWSK